MHLLLKFLEYWRFFYWCNNAQVGLLLPCSRCHLYFQMKTKNAWHRVVRGQYQASKFFLQSYRSNSQCLPFYVIFYLLWWLVLLLSAGMQACIFCRSMIFLRKAWNALVNMLYMFIHMKKNSTHTTASNRITWAAKIYN